MFERVGREWITLFFLLYSCPSEIYANRQTLKKRFYLFILVTVNSFSVTRLAVCDGNKHVRKVDLIPNLR